MPSPEYYHRSMLSNAAPVPRGDKEAHQEGEAAMTTDDITSMVSALFNALNGQHGEAARIAAVEAMHKLMADYINRDEPVRH